MLATASPTPGRLITTPAIPSNALALSLCCCALFLLSIVLIGGAYVPTNLVDRDGFPSLSGGIYGPPEEGYEHAASIPMETSSPSPTPACGLAWRVVPSPNMGTNTNELSSVAAISSDDIWAAGIYRTPDYRRQPLVQHWNGKQWSIVPTPLVTDALIWDMDAISSDDVWIVGTHNYEYDTLTMHWDGKEWSIVPSPDVGTGMNELQGVDAISANDVWAVGFWATNDPLNRTMVQHWNGKEWSIVPSPNIDIETTLYDVTAVSANDIWAVGAYLHRASGTTLTLTMHWDGSEWSFVPSPSPGNRNNHLLEVMAISSNDIWAIGYYHNRTTPSPARTIVLHWNGQDWSIVPSPSIGQSYHYPLGIDAVSSTDIWVGGYYTDLNTYYRGFTMHWDGSEWSFVPSPDMGNISFLGGVAALSAQDVWIVGRYDSQGAGRTVVEHYSDPCSSSTPTAVSTSTPAGTAVTATAETTRAATSTVTRTTTRMATATACALTFTDVPPDNTFYPFVRCLACRGIVGGYDDGTFRPNHNVTRGQIAKIVSEAAGFGEPAGDPIYEDVEVGSTFYTWINRLSHRGVMGGYPCGGAGEPCIPPYNRPYFRPSSNATRGQLAKIVSEAAGFANPPVGQTFEDVPLDSTFYVWVERLAARGVIGGYPCGGTGEPCGPANRPYFRANNNVTRGQASKIVANTFFPNCGP